MAKSKGDGATAKTRGEAIGVITKGSLVEGLEMKLDSAQNVEDMKAGKFVVIEGDKNDFFSMVTDMRLDAKNQEVLLHPPGREDDILRKVLAGTSTYNIVSLRPMLMMPKGAVDDDGPRPVKAIPSHFSEVQEAMEHDVAKIFGKEGDPEGRYFSIGNPLDMDTQVCLDMIRFAERSNGIFGKTGTGKSFLTRLALCGLIHYDKAVNLIFDMHNEYGFKAMKENGSSSTFVKGLKQLFGERVAIFSLDPQSTRARGVQADHEVYISYDQITVEDIAPLQDELRLNPTAVESAYLVYAIYKERWLRTLLALEGPDVEEFAREIGAHAGSLVALHRKLKRLENFPFMVSKVTDGDVVDRIMEYLDKGINVVLEFGQQTSMLCYLLVANIIARRIHEMYVKKSERFYATQRTEDQPRQLMITIEEAHKFLNPTAAKQTIFGTIAREMRKYYVSLLVVDQRPSSIDDEVLSQIGTRITALLNDEKDIQAVLTGVSGTEGLRSVLASLDSKQQALILGHAVPMPVVVKTRDYDTQFYKDMGCLDDLPEAERKAKIDKGTVALYGDN
ncbi:MAG: ATP-binding protein [Gemmatimonadetes bacterium]|jgi:DNA helicase HerA-like ATPase|nr:ATP-binding protein [Gemmatimonadota bacterium]MDE0964859.1 ATP-binding protein [Candidatus Latescibacterota bacterium]MBT5325990.1 ATP-binding protein [Gemmatimonadota bacterium]MBT5805530.1 ATP-binding protein [Gemmatimonadota bacterium]MBT6620547.1 ATP-binding protein [Gemmatimonadota bacterium]